MKDKNVIIFFLIIALACLSACQPILAPVSTGIATATTSALSTYTPGMTHTPTPIGISTLVHTPVRTSTVISAMPTVTPTWTRDRMLPRTGTPKPTRTSTPSPTPTATPTWTPSAALAASVSHSLLFQVVVDQPVHLTRLQVISPDESLAIWLTNPDQEVFDFDWSPNGKQVVFGTFETLKTIFVMDLAGKNTTQLTPETIAATMPVWSPDGKRVAFNCFPGTEEAEICVVNRDGSDLRRLTQNEDTDYVEGWSPDGKMLLFVSDRNRLPPPPQDGVGYFFDADVWVMHDDGTGQRRLTDGKSRHWDPVWSPDGQCIAFVSDKVRKYGVHLVDVDGQNERSVSSRERFIQYPQWLSDSQTLLYVAGDEIVFTSLEGKELNTLNVDLRYDPMVREAPCRPAPDSSQIACLHFPGIVIMDTEGNWIAFLSSNVETDEISSFQWGPAACGD